MVWTSDEDWVNKCMEFKVEGRRPVGTPRSTWLESVKVDMAELEIDREDVHDRKKWRNNTVAKGVNQMAPPARTITVNRKIHQGMLSLHNI